MSRPITGPDNDLDREAWWRGPEQPVEPEDYCDHGYNASTCGKCHDGEIEAGIFEMHLAAAFNEALRRIEGEQ